MITTETIYEIESKVFKQINPTNRVAIKDQDITICLAFSFFYKIRTTKIKVIIQYCHSDLILKQTSTTEETIGPQAPILMLRNKFFFKN